MCDIWKATAVPSEDMPFEIIHSLLKDIAKHFSPWRIQLTGGEPLLHKNIFDIIQASVALGFETGMVTNGSLITPTIAERMLSMGLFNINISLDSLVPEKHDYVRGFPGAFATTKRGIHNLLEARKNRKATDTKLIIKTVISNNNIDELLELIDYTQHNDLDGILFQPLQRNFASKPDANWFNHSDLWIRNPQTADRVLDAIIARKEKCSVIINSRRNLTLAKTYFRNPSQAVINSCVSGYSNLVIGCDGNCYLCAPYPSIGNIREESIFKIWTGERARQVRKQMSKCSMFCLNTCNEKRTLVEYCELFRHFFFKAKTISES